MTKADFDRVFEDLTGHPPLSWQRRLFTEHFAAGKLCHTIDLPTGLGKTMVMAIWLIAREFNQSLPRRLIYVVDQATDLVTKWPERTCAVTRQRAVSWKAKKWGRGQMATECFRGVQHLLRITKRFNGRRLRRHTNLTETLIGVKLCFLMLSSSRCSF